MIGVAVLVVSFGAGEHSLWAQAKKKPAEKTDKKADSKTTAKTTRDAATERALLKQTEKVETAHSKELEKIVTWAVSSGLKAEAEKLLTTMRAIDSDYAGLSKLMAAVEKTPAPKDETKVAELRATFAKKLETANDQNAKRLFDLATACMKLGLFTRAFDLVNDVVDADPDHKRARDILGFSWDATNKKWIRKWDAEMLKKCIVTEDGWVKREDKKKWDQGLRDYQGKWVSKEEEERIRKRNNYNMFAVESEHFRIETNLGRKQGWEYAGLLEDFYAEFFRFYLGFYDQTAGAKLLFVTAKNKKKHIVKVFPTRDDYLTYLKSEKNNDKLLQDSGGWWSELDQCSHFYYQGREETLHILYHEVTHQLFGETKPGSGQSKGNNWVAEGIASYMETWEKVDGKWKPGHKVGSNLLQRAKHILSTRLRWDLPTFLAIDQVKFHAEAEERADNYALSASLCHFLMHGQGELYREPFIQFISAYYEGKVVEDSLGRFIPVEGGGGAGGVIGTLETQFKEYMAHLGERAPEESSKPEEEKKEK